MNLNSESPYRDSNGTLSTLGTKLASSGGGLTPEQSAKLERALVSPLTAPLENTLVGVGTANEQIQIKLGDSLELSGSTSPFELGAYKISKQNDNVSVTTSWSATGLGMAITRPTLIVVRQRYDGVLPAGIRVVFDESVPGDFIDETTGKVLTVLVDPAWYPGELISAYAMVKAADAGTNGVLFTAIEFFEEEQNNENRLSSHLSAPCRLYGRH